MADTNISRIPPSHKELKKRSDRLRKNPTEAECRLASRLRDAGIRFHFQRVVGLYIPDFVLADRAVILEVDGDVHDTQSEYDIARDKVLRSRGFTVVRIRNEEVDAFNLKPILRFQVLGESPVNRLIQTANSEADRFRRERRAIGDKLSRTWTDDNGVWELTLVPRGDRAGVFETACALIVDVPKPAQTLRDVPRLSKDHLPKKPRAIKIIKSKK